MIFDEAFFRAGYLKTHINTVHNGQKDHKCDTRDKAFFRGDKLKKHINTVHNGQRN